MNEQFEPIERDQVENLENTYPELYIGESDETDEFKIPFEEDCE